MSDVFHESPMHEATPLAVAVCVDSFESDRAAARERALPALLTIAAAIRRNPGSGQGRRLTAFLGGLYHGERFPFDLTNLRALDAALADACLAVLNYDRYRQSEVHRWGVFDADDLNRWLVDAGCYYAAQRRRIGDTLYREQFGTTGHADEGLTG